MLKKRPENEEIFDGASALSPREQAINKALNSWLTTQKTYGQKIVNLDLVFMWDKTFDALNWARPITPAEIMDSIPVLNSRQADFPAPFDVIELVREMRRQISAREIRPTLDESTPQLLPEDNRLVRFLLNMSIVRPALNAGKEPVGMIEPMQSAFQKLGGPKHVLNLWAQHPEETEQQLRAAFCEELEK